MEHPDESLESFAAALDALRARIEEDLGPEDVRYVERVDRASKWLENIGRTWIAASTGPLGFLAGVTSLWVGKQLQATEIGHAALHGAYDRFPDAQRFHAHAFAWRTPIPEEMWCDLHNAKHHPHTNIIGKDPGVGNLPVNTHEREVALTRTARALAVLGTAAKIARKATPYYAREFLVMPVLAGPMWWKVFAGNLISEVMRDLYSAAALYAGHDGHDVAYYPEGMKAQSRGEWYRMQVEATNNFSVPWVFSVLCGGLDLHIEHHLFPKLPPHRLREIAPAVKRICEEHGVAYKIGSWTQTLRKVFRQLREGVPAGGRGIVRAA